MRRQQCNAKMFSANQQKEALFLRTNPAAVFQNKSNIFYNFNLLIHSLTHLLTLFTVQHLSLLPVSSACMFALDPTLHSLSSP